MADNIKRNIEDEKAFLQLQEQIRDAQRDAGKSLRSAGEYTKTILLNYREMQKVSARIKELKEEEGKVDAERAAIIRQQIEDLKKQRDEIKAINKEMASLGGVVRMGLSGLVSYLGQALTGYLEFSQKTKDVAAQIGLSSNNMFMMQSNIQQAGVQMARYGVSVSDALEAQQAYSDELGRSVILTQSSLENMAMIGKATGLGMAGMAGLTAQMEQFGLGAEDSANMIYSMYSDTTAMGLNAGKVIKKFQENIGLLNKLNFKNGIKGLQKMAQLSEKYKIDMNGIANASEKAFSPEGAIEMAAQLQVMGGAMASLGDPFQLMYKARNNPEKFAEDMAKAAAESATFNSQTGEFQVNAMEIDRLRVVAEATGQSMENLVEQAKTGAKINMFKGMLGGKGLLPEEQDAIAAMSQMVDGKAQIQIDMGKNAKPVMKELSQLSKNELLKALNEKKSAKEAAEQATGISERWTNFLNQLQVAVYPLFMSIEKYFTDNDIFTKLSDWGTSFAETIKKWATYIGNNFPQIMEQIKSVFMNVWNFLQGNWKELLISAAIGFVGYWVLSQAIAGLAFGLAAGKGILISAGGGLKSLFGSLTSKIGGTVDKAAGGSGGGLTSMATGLSSMGTLPNVDKGTMLLVPAAIGFTAMLAAIPSLLFLGKVNLTSLVGNMTSLAMGLSMMGTLPNVDKGAGILILASIGFAAMTLGVIGLPLIALFGTEAGIGLGFLATGLSALGAVAGPALMGVLVIGLLGVAMLGFAAAIYVVAMGVALIVDSFTNMFAVIGANGAGLFMAGLGFLAMAAGIGVLTLSLIAMGAAAIFALPGLLILGGVTSMLTETATALAASGGGEGIEKAVNAINSVDQNKLDALKDLSMWFSLIGASPTIKFEENLTVDGSIVLKGEAGGKTGTDWIKDPIFVSKLKELIEYSNSADRNGGKSR
jgi:hypothetical protein